MNRRETAQGFTLIELLIVVAIIAILAAIAVPNFLEAQVRSKISRAQTDMRTLATALESYAVDNNKYPYAQSLTGQPWLAPGGYPLQAAERCGGVTSPIAYLTSLPIDVFEHPITAGISIKAPLYYERAGFHFMNGTKETNKAVNVPADAVGVYNKLDGIGADNTTAATNDSLTPQSWVLYSIGPDLDFKLTDGNGNVVTASRYNLNNRYDPTNGTISGGNVLRFPGGLQFPTR